MKNNAEKKNDKVFVDSIKHGGMHSFFKRAAELGIKIKPLKNQPKVVRLSYGNKQIYVRSGSIPVVRMMGQFTKNKTITKEILNDVGLSVPKGIVLEKRADFSELLVKKNKLRFPLIVKPQNGSRAKGVTWNINNFKELKKAVIMASKASSGPILIEEMFVGDEYRALVLNSKVIGVVHKIPPTVYGDGESKVRDLIEKYNKDRATEKHLQVDKNVTNSLKVLGYNLSSIPEKGEKIILKNTFLMSEGARLVSVSKKMNTYYREICLKSVSALNLQFGGVDIIAKDITKKSTYVVLEVNPNPFYNMHEKELVEGMAVDVSALILKDLFPKLKIQKL